jgi:osmotically-inducible protein OsmY
MADRWRDDRERVRGGRDRDELRNAGETILGRADWGDRESDYEHGFRPMHVRDNWHAAERYAQYPRDQQSSARGLEPSRDEIRGDRPVRAERDYRVAGETALGRADWGDHESDYEHGYRSFREGHWPADRPHHVGKGPRGYQRSDERVFEDVCDRLTDDPRVDASDVEVRVENGEVTLTGTVRSRVEKHAACVTCTINSASAMARSANRVRRRRRWVWRRPAATHVMSSRRQTANRKGAAACRDLPSALPLEPRLESLYQEIEDVVFADRFGRSARLYRALVVDRARAA